MMSNRWKTEAADLRVMAQAVTHPSRRRPWHLRKSAAIAVLGAVRLVSERYGLEVMRRACAELVRHSDAWTSSLGSLPCGADGRVVEPVWMVASMARGVLALAGAENTRAALSFWATEEDVACWRQVLEPATA
jgi:hypothetical protein